MAYLRTVLLTALAILVVAFGINVTILSELFLQTNNSFSAYAAALIQSKDGLWWSENFFPPTVIKKELAHFANQFECVVIGSSRVMQISSTRDKKPLSTLCSTTLNLGVPGATIEDHFILTYLALKDHPPKKVILGMDFWTLDHISEPLWRDNFFQQTQENMVKNVQFSNKLKKYGAVSGRKKFLDMIGLEQTLWSLQLVGISRSHRGFLAAPTIDATVGGPFPLLFPDGSLVYSAEAILRSHQLMANLAGDPNKIALELTDPTAIQPAKQLNDPDSVRIYADFIRWIQQKGVEPILLMVPYHLIFWQASPPSPTTRALLATEQTVYQLGNELVISVFGTYNAIQANCANNEFLDVRHPMGGCVASMQKMM